MSTTHYEVGAAWQKIADDGKDFILENLGLSGVLHARFDSEMPADPNAAHHPLYPGDSLIRAGVSGDLYVRGHGMGSGETSIHAVITVAS